MPLNGFKPVTQWSEFQPATNGLLHPHGNMNTQKYKMWVDMYVNMLIYVC